MHRRCLNLLMHDNARSICSLYRMDLKHLFFETAEIAEQAAAAAANAKKKKLSMIESWNNDLRKPLLSVKPFNFFTLLRDSSIMMGDSSCSVLLDADFKCVLPMPPMRHAKGPNCVCFSIPDPNPVDSLSGSQCLFALNLVPGSCTESTFEVMNYTLTHLSRRLVSSYPDVDWLWSALPVPPFLDDPVYSRSTKMSSSMLLGNSTICVSSMEDGVGTFTFDTVSHEWSQAGNWLLPFCGKAEYVPNLKLWFALSPSSPHSLCAVDLPATGLGFESPPQLQSTWDYLDLPEERPPYKRHLLNMGSGRFCIVSFFKTTGVEDESAVFTGVEVRPCSNGDGPVQMVKHMSKRYIFGTHSIHWVL